MITEEQVEGFTLLQSPEEFRLTRDALALARFATLRPGDRVCDLGCGVGNVLIPLGARASGLILDGVELRDSAAALCRESLRRNGLAGTVVTGDLNCRYPELPWGRYDLVVANPPYFLPGSGAVSPVEARAAARTEDSFSLEAAGRHPGCAKPGEGLPCACGRSGWRSFWPTCGGREWNPNGFSSGSPDRIGRPIWPWWRAVRAENPDSGCCR